MSDLQDSVRFVDDARSYIEQAFALLLGQDETNEPAEASLLNALYAVEGVEARIGEAIVS